MTTVRLPDTRFVRDLSQAITKGEGEVERGRGEGREGERGREEKERGLVHEGNGRGWRGMVTC